MVKWLNIVENFAFVSLGYNEQQGVTLVDVIICSEMDSFYDAFIRV